MSVREPRAQNHEIITDKLPPSGPSPKPNRAEFYLKGDVGFGFKVGKIGPKRDKSGTFSNHLGS